MHHMLDWDLQATRKQSWQAENHVVQKHPERPDACQIELVQGQKCDSRPTEVEGNRGCPLPPIGQRGQDDDDDDDDYVWPAKLSDEKLMSDRGKNLPFSVLRG